MDSSVCPSGRSPLAEAAAAVRHPVCGDPSDEKSLLPPNNKTKWMSECSLSVCALLCCQEGWSWPATGVRQSRGATQRFLSTASFFCTLLSLPGSLYPSFSLYLRCERLTAYWGGSVAEVWAAGRGSTLEEHTAGQHWRGEGGGRGVGGRGWKE